MPDTDSYHGTGRDKVGTRGKQLRLKGLESNTATETQGKASRSTYLDVGLIHIGRLQSQYTSLHRVNNTTYKAAHDDLAL